MTTFIQFLEERCPSERKTSDTPYGFEEWVEELTTEELVDYAELYGRFCTLAGKEQMLREMKLV